MSTLHGHEVEAKQKRCRYRIPVSGPEKILKKTGDFSDRWSGEKTREKNTMGEKKVIKAAIGAGTVWKRSVCAL